MHTQSQEKVGDQVKAGLRSRTLILGVVLALVLVMTGCMGGSNTNNSDPTPQPSQTDDGGEGATPLSFTFYGHYDWMTTAPWADNEATRWIQENKQVTVEPIQSGGASLEKLNTMIVADDLPDVIMTDRGADVERLVQAGKLVALDKYYEKYPNFKKYLKESTLNLLRSEDGKIYQIPNWYTSGKFGNGGWMVNKKIYNELGRPKLETFDDLYDYLRLVKETYPDVVPLEVGEKGAGIEMMYGGFKEGRISKFIGMKGYPVGDQLEPIFTDPAYKEMLTYVNKLFRERLITQDALTQTQDAVKEKVNTGRVAVMVESNITTYGAEGHREMKAVDPEAGYEVIWPIHKEGVDKNQVYISGYETLGWNVNIITTAAEDPERIFAYFDWVTGPEGQKVLFFGPQGLYWDEEHDDGTPVPNDNYTTGDVAERQETMRKFEDFNWAGNSTFIDTAKMNIEMSLPEEQRSWETVAQSKVTWDTSLDITEFVNVDPLPDSEEGVISQRVADIYDPAYAAMLLAGSEQEMLSIFDKAAEDSEDAGLDKLLEYRTAIWQANLEKINADY